MELMHGSIVTIGILVLLLLLAGLFFASKLKKKDKFKNGTKAANTARIRKSGLYKKLSIRYTVLTVLMIAGFSGSIISSFFLAARPYKNDEVTSGVKKRDIILCLDVSFSLYDLNMEITDYLKEMVAGLEGDRIGISIFNSSSVTYVPLTDDYDYIIERLDDLHEYFVLQKEYMEDYEPLLESGETMTEEQDKRCDELRDRLLYFDTGTRYNSQNGSSFIGEGLATALYSFPNLEESERTRAIIMCTDNQLNAIGNEVVNLSTAAGYCKKYDVTVYGIFPSEEMFYKPDGADYSSCLKGFTEAAQKTGGQCYIRTDDRSVSAIVEDIQKQEAKLVNVVTTRQVIDLPQIPFFIMIICLAIGCLAGLVLQK